MKIHEAICLRDDYGGKTTLDVRNVMEKELL